MIVEKGRAAQMMVRLIVQDPGAATNLHFGGIVLRKVATHPAEPVQIACSYRRDNTNSILGIFKRDIPYSFRPGASFHF